MGYLTLVSVYWENHKSTVSGRYNYGLVYEGGRKERYGTAASEAEAEDKARELAAQDGLPCELDDVASAAARRTETIRRNAAEAAVRAAATAEKRAKNEHMYDVVSGKLMEPGKDVSDQPPLAICYDVMAGREAGGYLTDRTIPRAIPTTIELAEMWKKTLNGPSHTQFVVANYNGTPLAMTIEQAYNRGLREIGDW